VSSIVFAIVAASIVHAYFIQPFVIPTGSLERTLLVGDFLLVSKYHYGARVPMTPIAAPMVHDTLPIVRSKSYLKKPQLPYMRLPGFTSPKRNDKVVFNWPIDTVRYFRDPSNIRVDKPIDKKSNYVKRCVGIPGDEFSIIDGKIYIDGEPLELDERAKPQISYAIHATKGVSSKLLIESGVKEFMRTYSTQNLNQNQANALYRAGHGVYNNPNGSGYLISTSSEGINPSLIRSQGLALQELIDKQRNASLTDEMASKLRSYSSIDSVVKQLQPKGQFDATIYPHSKRLPWNVDQMGPFTIPFKGFEIELTPSNVDLYREVITEYEGHELSLNGTQVFIDGAAVATYRFEKDYYWMMGDNRHNSEDSRYWGFVPKDHILGKPIFIWMSIDGINDGISNWKIRWDRVFTTVDGTGVPRSYFKYFLALLVLGYGIDYLRKRKKKV
jgi:signal peptidase I